MSIQVKTEVYFELIKPYTKLDAFISEDRPVPKGLYRLEYTFSSGDVAKIRNLKTNFSCIVPIEFLKTVQIKDKNKLKNIEILYGSKSSRQNI